MKIKIKQGNTELEIDGVNWSTFELTKKYIETCMDQFLRLIEKPANAGPSTS